MNKEEIKSISPKSKRRKILFPREGIFQMDKKTDSKELFDKIENELKEKKNYKPELTLLEKHEIDRINELNKEFVKIINIGNIEQIKQFLDKGADVNIKNEYGKTALIHALEQKNEKCVIFLLKHPKIHVTQEILIEKLFQASRNGNVEFVEILLQKGVDVNTQDNVWDRTALMLALEKGNVEVAKLLAAHPGTEVNIKDKSDMTALMYALENKFTGIAFSLLERPEMNVNAQDFIGRTALMLALEKGNMEIASLLLQRPEIDVNARDKDDWNVINYAVSKNLLDLVIVLLKHPKIKLDEANEESLLFYVTWPKPEMDKEIITFIRNYVKENRSERNKLKRENEEKEAKFRETGPKPPTLLEKLYLELKQK